MLTDHPSPPQAASLLNSTVISCRMKHRGWTEHLLSSSVSVPEQFLFEQLKPIVEAGGVIAGTDLFGQAEYTSSSSGELQILGFQSPGTTLVLESDADAGGMQIGTLSGVDSKPLYNGGRIVGHFFEDADAKYCVLSGVLPADTTSSRTTQEEQVLQSIQDTLAGVGMDFRDVVRTWFYADRILDWYDDFNRVRTAFFKRHGITRIPASTGIGAANAAGAALVAKAIAVLPKNGNVTIQVIRSPLQCEATNYGSTFSRAIEVRDSSLRTVYVSGTASIEPGGKTIHVGNAAGQIEKTMEVIDALLEEAGMELVDTVRAIAYFRRSGDIPLWREYCRKRQFPPLPILLVPSDICRDDLLFEIELDAAVYI